MDFMRGFRRKQLKNKDIYLAWACLLQLFACSGGLSGPVGGGPVAVPPAGNFVAPIQESGAPGTYFDPGKQAKYRLSIYGDFQKTNEGTLFISGEVSKIIAAAPDFAGHVLRAVDFRTLNYTDVVVQPKGDSPGTASVELEINVPFIAAQEVLGSTSATLVFYLSAEAATVPSEQWGKTQPCADPKCDLPNSHLVVLEVKPMDLPLSNPGNDADKADSNRSKANLVHMPEAAP